MTVKQAKVAKEEFMATVNAGKFLLRAQIPFQRLIDMYKEGVLTTLALSTREKYRGYLDRYICPRSRNYGCSRSTASAFSC
jgi:hypothetical protein